MLSLLALILPFFPIGSYEVPDNDAELKAMAQAGFNLFVCHDKACLDRLGAAGAHGWVPLPMHQGRDPKLKARVEEVKDHPALAVWEAPDELVWNLTRPVDVSRGIDEGYRTVEPAIDKFREGAAYVRELDRNRHPIWLNEAAPSDMKLIRRYLDSIDITGCDDYPVHGQSRQLARVPDSTDRFMRIGTGKPVWMVLQGFAWREIMPNRKEGLAYPSFAETRWMAWTSITHGASAVLYWGMNVFLDGRKSGPIPPGFRQSLYAVASELSAVEPFLLAPRRPEVRVAAGMSVTGRRVNAEWVVAVINETDRPNADGEVTGLADLNGRSLEQLYGTEHVQVHEGAFVTRLLPYEVKLFATSRKGEAKRREGRDYIGVQNAAPEARP